MNVEYISSQANCKMREINNNFSQSGNMYWPNCTPVSGRVVTGSIFPLIFSTTRVIWPLVMLTPPSKFPEVPCWKLSTGRLEKPLPHPSLVECQQRRNQRITKTRARVEHVFAAIEQMGGKLLRTIGQARANFTMTMTAACYNLKRLVYFWKAGIEAFWRPKWVKPPMPRAIWGKNGATPPEKPEHCRRNWTQFGRNHRYAVGFIENIGLFEVPNSFRYFCFWC